MNRRALTITRGKYSQVENRAALEKELASRGLTVFSWSDEPGTTYAPHQHGHDEIIVVVSGAIQFVIEGQDYHLEQGDELVLPRGTVHSAWAPGSVSVQYFICS